MNLELAVIYSDAFLTKLTWQVLIEGYLTSLLDLEHGHIKILNALLLQAMSSLLSQWITSGPRSNRNLRYLCYRIYILCSSLTTLPTLYLHVSGPIPTCDLLGVNYSLGTVNSNTVNSKFHLIRSFFEIFARFLSFHV